MLVMIIVENKNQCIYQAEERSRSKSEARHTVASAEHKQREVDEEYDGGDEEDNDQQNLEYSSNKHQINFIGVSEKENVNRSNRDNDSPCRFIQDEKCVSPNHKFMSTLSKTNEFLHLPPHTTEHHKTPDKTKVQQTSKEDISSETKNINRSNDVKWKEEGNEIMSDNSRRVSEELMMQKLWKPGLLDHDEGQVSWLLHRIYNKIVMCIHFKFYCA